MADTTATLEHEGEGLSGARDRIPRDSTQAGDRPRMKKVEVVLQPGTFDAVRRDLRALQLDGMNVSEIHCCEGRTVRTNVYRGAEYEFPVRKMKLEMLVEATRVREVVEILSRVSQTAQPADQENILVYDVSEVLRPSR